jgi:hypothetical protein
MGQRIWLRFRSALGSRLSARQRELAQRHSDLLYSVPTTSGTEALVYVLFEDQSTVDPWMPFRLLSYVVRIWEKHLRDHPATTTLPPVIPVVLHHGATGARWTAARRLSELLDGTPDLLHALAPYLPDFAFVLDDLGAHGDEVLRLRAMTALGRAALWALESSRQPGRVLEQLPAWASVLHEVLAAPRGMEALGAVVATSEGDIVRLSPARRYQRSTTSQASSPSLPPFTISVVAPGTRIAISTPSMPPTKSAHMRRS